MEQQISSKLGREYVTAVYSHPAYLTYMQSTPCEMPGWMKHKLESRLLEEIPVTSDMQITPPLRQKAKKNQRISWWKWKGRGKIWLKTHHSENWDLGICSHHFMENRWGNNGNSDRLYFLELQTLDGDCHKIKRPLLLGRKVMTNLDSILKGREVTLPTRVCIVKALVFPVFMAWCESWTRKIAESESGSVVSDSMWPCGLWPTRLFHPWDFPRKSTGVSCHFLLQWIFPTQGSNLGLPHCRQTLYRLSHQGNLKIAECRRIDDFELWCWKRLLRVPWAGQTSQC